MKKLIHTATSVETFNKCPREYKAKYVTKDLPDFQSPEAVRGDAVHKAIEAYLLAPNEQPLPPHASGAQKVLDVLLANFDVHTETKVRVNEGLETCGWYEAGAWFGGIADVILRHKDDPDHVLVVDWKTGKPQTASQDRQYGPKYVTQSEMLAIGASKQYNAKRVTCLFVLLDHDVVKEFTYTFEDNKTTLMAHAPLFRVMRKMEQAVLENKFPATPNGLCKAYCGLTKCQHNGRFEGGEDYE